MARTPDRAASGGRRSWRHPASTARPATSAGGNKHLGRWLLSLLLVGLLSIFAWLLMRQSWGQRHLVAIPIWQSDPLTLSPV
jgi:hypothetical protein